MSAESSYTLHRKAQRKISQENAGQKCGRESTCVAKVRSQREQAGSGWECAALQSPLQQSSRMQPF